MGTPNYPKDMATEWNKLKREVKQIYGSANGRRAITTLGSGLISIAIGMVVEAGAFIKALHSNGSNAVVIGSFDDGTGNQAKGITVKRPGGSIAFQSYTDYLDNSYTEVRDRAGAVIFSDDTTSGYGLATPWLPYSIHRYSTFTTPVDLSSSTTYAGHYVITGIMQHPKIQVRLNTYCPSSGTIQIRLRDPATFITLAESAVVSDATIVTLVAEHPTFVFGSVFRYDVEVKRVSGASGVGATLIQTHGRQS